MSGFADTLKSHAVPLDDHFADVTQQGAVFIHIADNNLGG